MALSAPIFYHDCAQLASIEPAITPTNPGSTGDPTVSSGTLDFDPAGSGDGLKFTKASGEFFTGGTGPLCVAVRMTINTETTNQTFMAIGDSGRIAVLRQQNTGAFNRLELIYPTTGAVIRSDAGFWSTGSAFTVVAKRDSDGTCKIFIDGTDRTVSTSGFPTLDFNATYEDIDMGCQNGSNPCDATIQFAAFWDAEVADADVSSITEANLDAFFSGGSTTVNLSGVSATGSVGDHSISAGAVLTLAGTTSTGAVGTITATGAAIAALLGTSATGSAGSPTVTGGANVSVPGVSATGAVGAIVATGAANITITGVDATGAVGSISVSVNGAVSVSLAGVSATGTIGDPVVTGAAAVTIPGASGTGAVGTITATIGAITVSLSGVSATGSIGSMTVTGGAAVSMLGVSATGAAGTITASIPGSEVFIDATITITPAIGGTLTLQPAIDGDITIN